MPGSLADASSKARKLGSTKQANKYIEEVDATHQVVCAYVIQQINPFLPRGVIGASFDFEQP